MSTANELEIRPVSVAEAPSALRLLFATETEMACRDRVAATLRLAEENPGVFRHLLEARRADRRVGAVWGQVLPGRNGNVWPACLVPDEPSATAGDLQSALDLRLAGEGLVMAQSLLPVSATAAAENLRRQGYSPAARLLYLLCPRENFPTQPVRGACEFIPYSDADSQRMASLVEHTYVGTLDVPALDGVRTTSDVLDGYRATGHFSPDRWFFVRYQGHDIGCLLLADHPALNQWELVYMGLIPAARGQGRGQELVQFAQWKTSQVEREALLVSVDAANEPALKTYLRCRFSVWERRDVWIKQLV